MDKKNKYLENFRSLLRTSYLILKNHKVMSEKRRGFIEGYMAAGRAFGTSYAELQEIIDEENYTAFGMDIEERRKTFKEIPISLDEYFDVPAYIRNEKRINFI